MAHEAPGKEAFFKQIKSALNDNAQVLLAEPKIFHVSLKEFETTIALAKQVGFLPAPGPKLWISWSAVLNNR